MTYRDVLLYIIKASINLYIEEETARESWEEKKTRKARKNPKPKPDLYGSEAIMIITGGRYDIRLEFELVDGSYLFGCMIDSFKT